MSNLDTYLQKHFLNAEQFAVKCNISVDKLEDLVRRHLVPAPSYVVSDSSTVSSFVFGEMAAKESKPGQYFHPANVVWVGVARGIIETHGEEKASEIIRNRFYQNFQAALSDLNQTTMRLPDSFTDEGAPIAAGVGARTDLVWKHFLKGTFGLCVANPISEAAIARKEVLQEKLSQQSDNGMRTEYSPEEVSAILELVNEFAAVAMPFSPIEYHLSSRKILVDDMRDRLGAVGY
ncbi:MAG: DUF6058 family natural product biosynthesis protein [Calditrichia bacterium]